MQGIFNAGVLPRGPSERGVPPPSTNEASSSCSLIVDVFIVIMYLAYRNSSLLMREIIEVNSFFYDAVRSVEKKKIPNRNPGNANERASAIEKLQ